MEVETAIVSEKGQIVIPSRTRKRVGVTRGMMFAVMGGKDTIMLKKMHTPTREELLQELKTLTHEITQELKEHGITEEDVIRIALRGRRKKHA